VRIRFLGTSSAWPIPRLGCTCPQCAAASTDPRDRRTRSAVCVTTAAGDALLVDAGPDIYEQLSALGREGVSRIRAVVITHVHPDHYLGLVDLSAALPGKKTTPIHALDDNWKSIDRTFPYLFEGRRPQAFERAPMSFGATFEPVPGLRVTPLDARHFPEFSTSCLLVESDGAKLIYAPDFKETPDRDRMRGADLLVLDGSAVDKDVFGHLSIEGGMQLARDLDAVRVLFTHVGHVKRAHKDLAAEVARAGPFDLAFDGLEVDVVGP
jgi:phosphoribosyl 1,2-cyclic phosphodiesterase